MEEEEQELYYIHSCVIIQSKRNFCRASLNDTNTIYDLV